MLLGALNNIVLPDDCTSKGGKVRCKLVADGGSLFGRVVAPKLGAGVHGRSCVLPHRCTTHLLIAAMPDLARIRV